MPRRFGAATVPFEIAAEGKAVSDPALDVVSEAFQAVLEGNAAAAWAAVAPGEDICKTVRHVDPALSGLNPNDLPCLYVYREQERLPSLREWASESAMQCTFAARWVFPPTDFVKQELRQPIFNAVSGCLSRFIMKDRDPVWVHDSDRTANIAIGDTEGAARAMAAEHYGSSFIEKAGFDYSELTDSKLERLIVGRGAARMDFPSIVTRFRVIESDQLRIESPDDAAAYNFAPTAIDLTITTGGDDPLVVQHEREPDT